MLSRYFSQQKEPQLVSGGGGKGGSIQVSNDITLPYQSNRWVAPNYLYHRQEILTPVNNSLTFQTGSSEPIRFSVSTGENIVVPLNEMKFSYKVRVKMSGTPTYLTKTDALNHTYCQVAGLNPATGALVSGSSSATASTVSALYLRNSCSPFRLFEIKERQLGKKLESIMNPALYCQAVLTGQSPFFWDDNAGVSQASEYCADVITFRDPRYYFPPVTIANNQTYYQDPTPTAMPILNPENGIATSRVMQQVLKQQMYLWPTDQSCTYDDGGEIYFFPISDLQNCPLKLPTRWCPLLFEFTPDTYSNAVTDVTGWYNSTNGWTLTSNNTFQGGVLEIFDCKLYIEKYFLQVSEVPKIVAQLSGNSTLDVPYSMVQQQNLPFPASQSSIDFQLNASQYQNLERILILCRRKLDATQSIIRDSYILRNGSDADIATTGTGTGSSAGGIQSTTNYTNGIIGTAIDVSGNLITNPATAIAGGLIWTARNYNGIHRVQIKWLSEELVRQSDFIYVKPYNFRNVRDWCKEVFVKNEKHECELRNYEYEGIDPVSYAWTNMNSSFFLAFDFTSVKGSEMSGISLAKSPLDVNIYMQTSNNVPQRNTDLTLDMFYQLGSVARFSMSGVSVEN